MKKLGILCHKRKNYSRRWSEALTENFRKRNSSPAFTKTSIQNNGNGVCSVVSEKSMVLTEKWYGPATKNLTEIRLKTLSPSAVKYNHLQMCNGYLACILTKFSIENSESFKEIFIVSAINHISFNKPSTH